MDTFKSKNMAQIIGFQIESRDGKQRIPDELHSFEIFPTFQAAINFIQDAVNPWEWAIIPIREGDIEEYEFIY